jgi:hypothetical protein
MKKQLAVSFVAFVLLLGILPSSAMAKKKRPPTCTLNASPSVLARPGEPSTLSWTTTKAKTFTISSVGDVPTSGSLTVTPVFTTNYTGTATGSGGTATCSASVEVRSFDLAGDWGLLMEHGIVKNADEEESSRVPADSFHLHLQEGTVYEYGHLYTGSVHGYHGSWVHAWLTPNVRHGHPKYLEVTVGIPDTLDGSLAGTFVLSCNLFLGRGESHGWGVMNGEYWEILGPPIPPGTSEVPNELFISTCRIWR